MYILRGLGTIKEGDVLDVSGALVSTLGSVNKRLNGCLIVSDSRLACDAGGEKGSDTAGGALERALMATSQ